jgi:hypothetical protein
MSLETAKPSRNDFGSQAVDGHDADRCHRRPPVTPYGAGGPPPDRVTPNGAGSGDGPVGHGQPGGDHFDPGYFDTLSDVAQLV